MPGTTPVEIPAALTAIAQGLAGLLRLSAEHPQEEPAAVEESGESLTSRE